MITEHIMQNALTLVYTEEIPLSSANNVFKLYKHIYIPVIRVQFICSEDFVIDKKVA